MTLRVVVCVENEAERRATTSLIESAGHSVIAETDVAFQAGDVAEQFEADALVIDLRVRVELGRDPLSDLDRPDRAYHLIVMADFPREIEPRPAVSVIGRADDHGLMNALERLTDARGSERRRAPARERPARDPSSLYDGSAAFYEALNAGTAGDLLVAVTLDNPDRMDAVATACRKVMRFEDYILRQSTQLVLLLIGVEPAHAESVVGRLESSWDGPDHLRVAWRQLGETDVPADLFTEVIGALRAA